jgi:NitT/TauT family transport system substrate-binding protein
MRFADYGVDLYGHAIVTTPDFAAKHPDVVKKVVKGVAEGLKAAIADPAASIAAIKKREPLVDEKVELGRLQLVIKNAIVTDHVKREGLSAVDPARMKKTIEMVAQTFKIPAADAASTYKADFLPPRAELKLP